MYLLVWRDTWSKAYVIQEEPPLKGTDAAKEAFIARWEDEVNEKIAKKHPQVKPHRSRMKYVIQFLFPNLRVSTTRQPSDKTRSAQKPQEKGAIKKKSIGSPSLLNFFVFLRVPRRASIGNRAFTVIHPRSDWWKANHRGRN